MRNKLSILLLYFMLIFASAAASADLSVSYNVSSKELLLCGNMDEVKALVNIMILPDKVIRGNISVSDIANDKHVLKTIRTNADVSFTEKIIMPLTAKSGIYNVLVNYGEKVVSGTFSHINNAETQGVLDLMNKSSEEKFKNIIDSNINSLGISKEYFSKYGDSIKTCMFVHKPFNGYNISTFFNELNKIIALNLISDGEIDNTMIKYSGDFGISYEDEFKSLSTAVKSKFSSDVSSFDFSKYKASDILMKSLIMAQVTESTAYSQIQEVILKYKEYIGLSLTNYYKLSEYKQSTVFSELFDADLNVFDDIKPKFNSLVDEALKTPKSPGFSGGGGGKNTNSFTTPPLNQIKNDGKKVILVDISNHWSREIVTSLFEKGIVNGLPDGTFQPDNQISRAEFIKIVVSALKLPNIHKKAFDDISESDWFYETAAAAKDAGLVIGYNGQFNPYDYITREDAALILYKSIKSRNAEVSGVTNFADNVDISNYAKEAVSALAANKIIQGYNMKFMPKNNTTKAEAATLIYKLLEFLKEV